MALNLKLTSIYKSGELLFLNCISKVFLCSLCLVISPLRSALTCICSSLPSSSVYFFHQYFALKKKCARCSSKTWRKKNFVWSLFGTIWESRCLVMFGKVNVKVVFLWLRTEDWSVAFSSFVLINLKYYSSFPAVSLSWVMTEHNLNILFRMCECIVVCTVVSLTYQLTFLYM